jgi:hypothetical protein
MSHSASGEPPAADRRVGPVITAYSATEWELLTRLPGRVIVAATSAEPDSPRRAVRAGLAGLDGIAAGRAFDSDLIRAVVAAIYAEPDHGRPSAERTGDGARGLPGVLAACRSAVQVLAVRADPADSAAYRQWVQSVAARVCRRARSDDPFRPAGVRGGVPDRWFLDHLGEALGLV